MQQAVAQLPGHHHRDQHDDPLLVALAGASRRRPRWARRPTRIRCAAPAAARRDPTWPTAGAVPGLAAGVAGRSRRCTTVTATTCGLMDSALEIPYQVSLDTPVTGTTTMMGLACGLAGISPRPSARPARRVVAVDPGEQRDEHRYRQHHDPRALGELGHQEHHGGHGGRGRAEAVKGRLVLPVRWPGPPPVHDQAGLRQREPGEHPDGEQRDQRQGVARHGDEQRGRQHRQGPDPQRRTPAGHPAARTGAAGSGASLSRLASTGRPPKEVLAASASTIVMVRDIT